MKQYLTVILLAACSMTAVQSDPQRQKHILVLGGNAFMGGEVVLRLLNEGYRITTTNRGNWYWDNPVRVSRHVHKQFACDRDDSLLKCWDLRDYLRGIDFFDAVVDFTCYKGKSVDDIITALDNKIGLYLLISSDSVYMVSKRDQHREADPDFDQSQLDPNRLWKEEDAVRPYSATLRERLNEADPYGNDKMECEEAVIKQRRSGGVPYVSLRLPDVLGGRDTTNRWWPYQLWLQFYRQIQTPFRLLPKWWDLKTSYVYLHDVVDVVSLLLSRNSSDVWDQAYNVALDRPMSIRDLIEEARLALGVGEVQYERLSGDVEDADEIKGTLALLPSVDIGAIDSTKVKTVLGWSPTPVSKAMRNVTAFYKWAFGKFPLQRNKAVKTVIRNLFANKKDPEEGNKIVTFQTEVDAEIRIAEQQINEEDKVEKKDEL